LRLYCRNNEKSIAGKNLGRNFGNDIISLVNLVLITIIVGVLTTILSVIIKVVGFPDQMRKNYKRKSTEGVSSAFYILSVVTYVVWTIYGILKGDWVVTLAQGLGIITTGIIVYQIFIYRKKK
jgi:MtN3 and saliva related transmembrane protein